MSHQHLRNTLCANFQAKRTTLTQICPKIDFGVRILKNYVQMQNQLLQDTMCDNFQAKRTTFTFSDQICLKRILGSNFEKLSPDAESTPPRYHVC